MAHEHPTLLDPPLEFNRTLLHGKPLLPQAMQNAVSVPWLKLSLVPLRTKLRRCNFDRLPASRRAYTLYFSLTVLDSSTVYVLFLISGNVMPPKSCLAPTLVGSLSALTKSSSCSHLFAACANSDY